MGQAQPAFTADSGVLQFDGVDRLGDVTAEWAWGGSDGTGARVAVVDSGIEADHPLLGGSVVADGVAVTVDAAGTTRLRTGPHDDAYGHGTACAGIVHAIAPGASITSVRVLEPGVHRAAAFLRGLEWAIEQRFDVINLSLGTTQRPWALDLYELCDEAYHRNCLVVTAANNVAALTYPAFFGTVVSVACSTTDDPMRFHFNPSPPPEFLARGIGVRVPWRDGGEATVTGNSYAAAHLSGIAALVRAHRPRLRPFQIKAALWAVAANVQAAPPASRWSPRLRRTSRWVDAPPGGSPRSGSG